MGASFKPPLTYRAEARRAIRQPTPPRDVPAVTAAQVLDLMRYVLAMFIVIAGLTALVGMVG